MAAVKPSRGMRVLLFASLALNLLVVSAVVGFLLVGPDGARRGGPHGMQDPALPYTRAFEEDERRALRRTLRREIFAKRDEVRAVRESVLSGYREALVILRAEPFDAAALEAVLAAQAARSAEVRVRGQRLLSGYLEQMTPAERAAYADRLEAVVEEMRLRRPKRRD